jgi:hypothetical protein
MVFNVFETPYECWETRKPTLQEMMQHSEQTGEMLHSIRDKLICRVTDHFEAAKHMLTVGADGALGRFIEDALDNSPAYKELRSRMPSRTPKEISDYQKNYPSCDSSAISQAIDASGCTLPEGIALFHGGFWPHDRGSSLTTTRPLSTSLCPQVALRNAVWKGKAFDAGEIHLFVLKVVNPKTNVFVFRSKGTNLGHEKEVLFSAGAMLTLKKKTRVRDDYNVCKVFDGTRTVSNQIPAFVLEIEVS